MRNEYFITNALNETFLLYTRPNLGLLLRKNNLRTNRDEVLYEKCSKNIDVCMNNKSEIYVLCQNDKGNIVGICYRENNWHKFDILIPKSDIYYEKNFYIDCFNENIFGFYNIILDNKNILCAQNIKEKSPVAITSLDQTFPLFSACKISNTDVALIFSDEEGILGLKVFNTAQNKSTWYIPLLKSSDIKSINICITSQKLHIVFNKDDNLFYICLDLITRVQNSMFDIGPINTLDEVILSPSKKDIKIYIINKDEIQINCFDINGKKTEIKDYNGIKEEIINLKMIFENITITYPSIVINRQHINLYNSLNKIDDKDENLEQKLLDLTKQIEDIKNKMR